MHDLMKNVYFAKGGYKLVALTVDTHTHNFNTQSKKVHQRKSRIRLYGADSGFYGSDEVDKMF